MRCAGWFGSAGEICDRGGHCRIAVLSGDKIHLRGCMRLIDVRIRNVRSIADEQVIPIGKSATIVGPNNSGKTNVLRAVQMLFTGHENRLAYTRERDLFEGAGRERTTIAGRSDGGPGGVDEGPQGHG